MTKNDILSLANAGFTAEQIVQIAGLKDTKPAQEQPQTGEASLPITATPVQPMQMYQPMPAVNTTYPVMGVPVPSMGNLPVQPQEPVAPAQTASDDKIDALIRTLQANAIINNPMPEEKTAEDVLLSFINPETKQEV